MFGLFGLCAPALIYVVFCVTQIVIDTFKGLYNLAFFKFIVMIFITGLLNILCNNGLSLISWIIVFIPFIFMSVIVAILLYVFGFDPETGRISIKCVDNMNKKKSGNLLFKVLKYDDIINEDDVNNDDVNNEDVNNDEFIAPYYTTDLEYQS